MARGGLAALLCAAVLATAVSGKATLLALTLDTQYFEIYFFDSCACSFVTSCAY
jgi:hypothetical protein